MFSHTHYTDNILEGFGAVNYGPYTRIRPKYKDDGGIHAHEQTHANQWWAWVGVGLIAAFFLEPLGGFLWYYALLAGVGMHAVLYLLVPAYKLWCEVAAYREQAKHYADDRRLLFARFIATKYRLNITTEDAYKLLTRD